MPGGYNSLFAHHAIALFKCNRGSEWLTFFAELSGRESASPGHSSLDELSFIYFVRTLPLLADSVYSAKQHFDSARNPVTVHVVGKEEITVEAGVFATIIVEMRVTDPRRFKDGGLIKLNITDDARRLPVRIEGAAPLFGTAVFTLESFSQGPEPGK